MIVFNENIKYARIKYMSYRFSIFFPSRLHDCNSGERRIFINTHCFFIFNEKS